MGSWVGAKAWRGSHCGGRGCFNAALLSLARAARAARSSATRNPSQDGCAASQRAAADSRDRQRKE
eukprot:m.323197 g.323197  ORF g.323197 m.323197 type:complete len:66 (+) comp27622_c0_seq2:319-516(+)